MAGMNSNIGVLVVPDSIVEKEQNVVYRAGSVMAGNYFTDSREEKKEIDNRLRESTYDYTAMRYYEENPIPPMTMGTRVEIRESNNGLTMTVAFVVIYMGVVFLISSAAMLALKALSESIDSTEKYSILRKIGCEDKVLKKALFAQIGVYFVLPMLVAAVHSVFGLRYVSYMISSFSDRQIGWGVAVTAVLMVILYGGYLLATYSGSKRIVGLD